MAALTLALVSLRVIWTQGADDRDCVSNTERIPISTQSVHTIKIHNQIHRTNKIMERPHTGYYPDPYVQYPRLASQVYPTSGTGNSAPRTVPAGATMDYLRTGPGAGEGPRRVEYYVQEHSATTGARPPVREYYAHGPPDSSTVKPVPAAAYYTQEPSKPQGGSKSCGCGAPKVQYTYTQAPIARDPTPVPLSAATRHVLPPTATNQPPTGYYYVQEPAPTPARVAPMPAYGDTYPQPRPYPDSRGQQIIGYERYVVPASTAFEYDPTSASHDYYRPSLPPGALQPSGYRYDSDGYSGHVTGSSQQLPQEVAERFGAMRIGGGGGGGGRDVIYVPRPSSNDVVNKDSGMWRPRK